MDGNLAINVPAVVHETIDGEAILIHMGTGTYYSLDGTGTEVWALLERNLAAEEIVSLVQEGHDADPGVVETAVLGFLDELAAEGLVVPAPGDAPSGVRAAAEPVGSDGAFAAPVLHKYTDMQEFMLVDPLHDVDESAGWPHAKAG